MISIVLLSAGGFGPGVSVEFIDTLVSPYWFLLQDIVDQVGSSGAAIALPNSAGHFDVIWTTDASTWHCIDSFDFKALGEDPSYTRGGSVSLALMETFPVVAWQEESSDGQFYLSAGYGSTDGSAQGTVLNQGFGSPPRALSVPLCDSLLLLAFRIAPSSDVGLAVYNLRTNSFVDVQDLAISSFTIAELDLDPTTGQAYLFGSDESGGSGYYRISWSGSFSVDGPYYFHPIPILDLGNGYVLDAIISSDAGLALAGSQAVPLYLVGLAAYNSQGDILEKALVIATEDTFYVVTQLTTDTNNYLYWGQLITGPNGEVIVAYERMTRADTGVGWGWFDIFYTSANVADLSSWSDPVNLTQTPDLNESLLKVPRHFVGDTIWMSYIYDSSGTDYYAYIWQGGKAKETIFVELARSHVVVGVHESASATRPSYRFDGRSLSFLGLPAGTRVQVFNASGRLVKDVRLDESGRVSLADLGSGAYFFRAGKLTGKAVVR